MKAHEVWNMWKDNPDLYFENTLGNTLYLNKPDGTVRWSDGGIVAVEDFMSGDWEPADTWEEDFMDDDWEPVDIWEKVSMMRAIQEFLVYKRPVKMVFSDGSATVLRILGEEDMLVLNRHTENSTWYIERRN